MIVLSYPSAHLHESDLKLDLELCPIKIWSQGWTSSWIRYRSEAYDNRLQWKHALNSLVVRNNRVNKLKEREEDRIRSMRFSRAQVMELWNNGFPQDPVI